MIQKIKNFKFLIAGFVFVFFGFLIFEFPRLSQLANISQNKDESEEINNNLSLSQALFGCKEAFAQAGGGLVCHPTYAIASSSGETINPFWASDGVGNQIRAANLTWRVITNTEVFNANPLTFTGPTFSPKFMIYSPSGRRTASTTVQVEVTYGSLTSRCCVAIPDGIRYRWGSPPLCKCYKSNSLSTGWRETNPQECELNLSSRPSECGTR